MFPLTAQYQTQVSLSSHGATSQAESTARLSPPAPRQRLYVSCDPTDSKMTLMHPHSLPSQKRQIATPLQTAKRKAEGYSPR